MLTLSPLLPLFTPRTLPTSACPLASLTFDRLLQETRETVPPQPDQATIRILATGLCGSDNHYYNHGRNGSFILQAPLVLGHEAGGVIAALPESYKGPLKVGDNVAIEAGVECGSCEFDRQGRYNLCKVSEKAGMIRWPIW